MSSRKWPRKTSVTVTANTSSQHTKTPENCRQASSTAARSLGIASTDVAGSPALVSVPKSASLTSQSRVGLDVHATLPTGKEKAEISQATVPKKKVWHAYSRYYSNVNHFPDDGPRRPKMGVERVRQLNQVGGPVNTLTSTITKRQYSDSSSTNKQTVSKRQKFDQHWSSPTRSRLASDTRAEIADPIQDNSPPPANIKSDIVQTYRGSKRRSVYTPSPSKELSIKRQKGLLPYEKDGISEDELSVNHPTCNPQTRRINFSSIQPSRERRFIRGNISSTPFNPKHAGSDLANPPMRISKAVSGKDMYNVEDGNHPTLTLRPSAKNPSILEAWSDNEPNEAYAWLTFDVKDLKSNIKYGQRILSFRRSATQNKAPTVVLEFATKEGATELARLINHDLKENNTMEYMEQILANLWKNATQSQITRIAACRSEDSNGNEVILSNNVRENTEPAISKPRKLKDRMTFTRSTEERPIPDSSVTPQKEAHDLTTSSRRGGMETRRSWRSSPSQRKPSPILNEKWSLKNKSWEKEWTQTLVYPATGRNRASVDKEDINRLDEGEFLNDNLISFYLRYLQTNMGIERPELVNRVHIFNTFFFEKLTSRKGGINYEGVRSWTAKLDLFSYDYIVVPVNENAHWYLAVICNVPKILDQDDSNNETSTSLPTDALGRPMPTTPILAAVERELSDVSLDGMGVRRSSRQNSTPQLSSPAKATQAAIASATSAQAPRVTTSRRLDSSQPRIVTLDSLGSYHPSTCKALREYLAEEALDKKTIALKTLPGGMKASGLPEQSNFCDCGVFVLGYMEGFLNDPDGVIRKILKKESIDWSINTVELRRKVRDILFALQKEQNERLGRERTEKRQLKRSEKSPAKSTVEISTGSLKNNIESVEKKLATSQPQQSQVVVYAKAGDSTKPPISQLSTLTSDRKRVHTNYDTGSIATVSQKKLTPANHTKAASTDDDAVIMVKTGPQKPASASNTGKVSGDRYGMEISVSRPPKSLRKHNSSFDSQDSVRLVSVQTKSQSSQQSLPKPAKASF